MASAQAIQSADAASVTDHAASFEESVQALTGILTEVRKLSGIAEDTKKHIELVLREEYEAQNPNPLAKLARKSFIAVRLLTPERNAHYGMTRVRSDEPVLYENRLWFWYQDATWVLEYDAESREWSAVEASLPVNHPWDDTQRVPASGGAEIRSVLPIKYKAKDADGREVWRWTEVSPRPACWAGPDRRPAYRDGDSHFWLGNTVRDYDGRTMYEAELQSVFTGGSGGRSTDILKLLLQTQRLVDDVTINEKYIEVEVDDLKERKVNGKELTIYTDEEGHDYVVDTAGMIEKDGIKKYQAVRCV